MIKNTEMFMNLFTDKLTTPFTQDKEFTIQFTVKLLTTQFTVKMLITQFTQELTSQFTKDNIKTTQFTKYEVTLTEKIQI
jgi:hypothetical protein